MKLKIVNKSSFKLPEYKTLDSAGMDLKAFLADSITIKSLQRTLISTGLFIEIPKGFEGQIRARSGLAIKHGISLVNGIGTIDSDYRGELKIAIVNLSNEPFTIHNGDRVAQLVINKYERVDLIEVETIDETERGTGGFGSTGI
ncbi:MAG: dUTP diphosphatase [Peptostreptococcaceae bacterium]|nr:dUTP diphosphatase [Peptostreptococcaceae bacterium]